MASVTKSFRCKHTFFRNSENPTGICKYFIDVNHQQNLTYTQLVDIWPSKVPSQRLHLLSPLPWITAGERWEGTTPSSTILVCSSVNWTVKRQISRIHWFYLMEMFIFLHEGWRTPQERSKSPTELRYHSVTTYSEDVMRHGAAKNSCLWERKKIVETKGLLI